MCVCVCVCVCARAHVCVCVCEREREREEGSCRSFRQFISFSLSPKSARMGQMVINFESVHGHKLAERTACLLLSFTEIFLLLFLHLL